jgi:peptidyl-prolyl cis-trans isomerase D
VPTAEEVAAYFAAHADDYRLPDQRAVDYLLVDEAKLRAGVEIERTAIESEYAARRSEFELPEQVRARHILIKVDENRSREEAERIVAGLLARNARGESFERLASEHSEDPGSRDRGGDLGLFGRGAMVPPFEEAAFTAPPGEVVGPVETTFGLHLIEVVERQPARVRPLTDVEEALRARLAQARAAELAEARARALAERIGREQPKTEEAWKALTDGEEVVLLSTPLFGEEEIVPGVGRNPEFAAATFALSPGGASAPVRVARGWAILRLREAQPARAPELAEVEPRVRLAAQREKAAQLALAELERARSALSPGRGLAEAAAALALEIEDSDEFGRRQPVGELGVVPALAEAAFALAPGELGAVAVPQGAVLFEVVERTSFDAARFAAERDEQRESLRRTEMNRLLASLLAERRREVGVRYDTQLVERLGLAAGG